MSLLVTQLVTYLAAELRHGRVDKVEQDGEDLPGVLADLGHEVLRELEEAIV